ncbi:hypothetical protein E4U55_005392 [Claviceps digitariae]|nr:hypothetical protein E4U55_005392 [Claviceps digitariae]
MTTVRLSPPFAVNISAFNITTDISPQYTSQQQQTTAPSRFRPAELRSPARGAALLLVDDLDGVDRKVVKLCAPCVVAVVTLAECPDVKAVELGPGAVTDLAVPASSLAVLLLVLVAIDDAVALAASADVEFGAVRVAFDEGARVSADADSDGGDGPVLQIAATRRPFCASSSSDLAPVLTMAHDF